MIEATLELPFMGYRVGTKLKKVFPDSELQLGLMDIADSVQYILRGVEGVVTPCVDFLKNAHIGNISYNPATHAYSVVGLDGATATIQVYDVALHGDIDLEDTFPLSGGAGTYTFEIPLPGRYMVIIWGETKCKTLMVEV